MQASLASFVIKLEAEQFLVVSTVIVIAPAVMALVLLGADRVGRMCSAAAEPICAGLSGTTVPGSRTGGLSGWLV